MGGSGPSLLGVDIGLVSLSHVLLRDGQVISRSWSPHHGNPSEKLRALFKAPEFQNPDLKVGLTGSGAAPFAQDVLDPLVCATRAVVQLAPAIRRIILVGGERSGRLDLDGSGQYLRHLLNGGCACGTGVFLQGQATRLGMSWDEFVETAEKGVEEGQDLPRIASRCAVFGRTDVVHLLQSGASRRAICAALFQSTARGVAESLFQEKVEVLPTVLLGGMAKLPIFRVFLEQILGFSFKHTDFPENIVAYGAALAASIPLSEIEIRKKTSNHVATRPALRREPDSDLSAYVFSRIDSVEVVQPREKREFQSSAWLGIDVGSRSTKAVVLDDSERPLIGAYTWTEGRPLVAIQKLFAVLRDLLHPKVEFAGVGVTGSGRKLVSEAIRADCSPDEITAHAKCAILTTPDVDTIIELGGQDSKFTRLSKGVVTEVAMNTSCSAGTGSFLEEQASRLGLDLDAYDSLAWDVEAPLTSERCTLFMERDTARLFSEGTFQASELLAAALHSVCINYFKGVVGAKKIGKKIVMQGATARNRALVAAFEARLGSKISVTPLCHLAGAIGSALIVRDLHLPKSLFRGLTFSESQVSTKQEQCDQCSNHCTITCLSVDGCRSGFGMRCGRELESPRRCVKDPPADLARKAFLKAPHAKNSRRGRIGLVPVLEQREHWPFWSTFWAALGFEITTIKARREHFEQGRELAGSVACAPALIQLGQGRELLESDCDALFFPTVLRSDSPFFTGDPRVSEQRSDSYYCFLEQYVPTILAQSRTKHTKNTKQKGPPLISPLLSLDEPFEVLAKVLEKSFRHTPAAGLSNSEILAALETAREVQSQREEELERAGREIFRKARRNEEFVVVLLDVPCARGQEILGFDIGRAFGDLGVAFVWQDMLPRRARDDVPEDGTHWHHGQRILGAANWIARQKAVYPISLSRFACGPDPLILPRVREMMETASRPMAVIQLDPQGADAGFLTRLEAAVEAFGEDHNKKQSKRNTAKPILPMVAKMSKDRTFLVPRIDDVICRFWQAMFRGGGYDVQFFDGAPADVAEGQNFTCGGECLAIPSIIGGAVRSLRSNGAHRPVVFVPTSSYSCAYPEFVPAIRRGLDWAGFDSVGIYAPNLFATFPGASTWVNRMVWEVVLAADILRRAGFERRPVEQNPGETDEILEETFKKAEKSLLRKKGFPETIEEGLEKLSKIPVKGADPRPRVLVVGNLFIRFNPFFTQGLLHRIQKAGGRIITPPSSDYTLTARLQNERLLQQKSGKLHWKVANNLFLRILLSAVDSWEDMAKSKGFPSPLGPFSELEQFVTQQLGVPWALGGETLSVLGRVLQAVETRSVDAVVHINSLFCQPAHVSEALLRGVLDKASIPFVNLAFEGGEARVDEIEPLIQLFSTHRGQR